MGFALIHRAFFRGLRILSFCAVAGAALAPRVWSAPLQILHTNDLHGHVQQADSPDTGGYAAVKGTLERLKAEAAGRGIATVVVDAGDFTEGSIYHLVDGGSLPWRMMNAMGYDAVTIGNHDLLVGADELNSRLAATPPSFAFLGANVLAPERYRHINALLRPYTELVRDGLRIAIVGATINGPQFSWLLKGGRLENPAFALFDVLGHVRPRNDLVVALTHLGPDKDASLVHDTSGIDLVVGGHSHTPMKAPRWERAEDGRWVPIVQAGRHGSYVGRIIVDVEKGERPNLVEYSLVPITSESPRDREMERMVRDARVELDAQYGNGWLTEVIGVSPVPLERQDGLPTVWSRMVVDSMREVARADLSMDIPVFTGPRVPPGPVTREDIFNLYPRTYSALTGYGWTVWVAEARGWLIELALKEAVQFGGVFGLSGVSYELDITSKGKVKVRNLRIGGKAVNPFKRYSIAVPEGIGRPAVEMTPLFKLIVHDARDTGMPIWLAVEERIRRSPEFHPEWE